MKKAETPSLTYSPRNAWDVYTTATQKRQMDALVKRYMDFLSNCKTERETVAYVQKRLQEAGFSEDFKKNTVFRNLRGKAIFAARKGKIPLQKGVHLIAAHADSPRLDFKQRPLVEQPGVAQAKTHYYGGIRKYQWLARPLALHGVVVLENGKSISVAIGEKAGEPVFTIADLLPHLARKQNSQTLAEVFDGEKLNIILGHSPAPTAARDKDIKEPIKQHVLELLNAKYGIREEDLVTAELQVVPAGPATYVGFDKGLVGGYGQDDRICVFPAVAALLNAKNSNRLCPNMAVMFWDKEEIGSDGATGAASRFLQYCFEDLARAWAPGIPVSQVLLNTRALSADVDAAFDPDFPEVHEKQNAAQLGHGPVCSKYSGSGGKYGASDADAEFYGYVRGLFNARNIPWQPAELGKVDVGGGGTVALFLAAYGMQVIDCGPALLAMHSPFELASCVDILATAEAYMAFLEGLSAAAGAESLSGGGDVFFKNCPRPLSNSPPPLKKLSSGRSGRSPSLSGGEGFSAPEQRKGRLSYCHACCLIEEGFLRHARRTVTRRLTSPYPAVRLFLHHAHLPGGVARLSARSFLFSATRHPLTNAAKNEKRTS